MLETEVFAKHRIDGTTRAAQCFAGGGCLGLIASYFGGWALLLLWPTYSLIVIGTGYLWRGPVVFGKRPDGTLSLVKIVQLYPYFAANWLIWHLRQWFRTENLHQNLCDDVLIGQRLPRDSLPSEVKTVIDLTCEFAEPRHIRTTSRYVNFPILDGVGPSFLALDIFLDGLQQEKYPIYIHCASGRGRTGLVAASLLLKLGKAKNADSAIREVKSKRPLVQLGRQQAYIVDQFASRYCVSNS